jgi:hypothetical protein
MFQISKPFDAFQAPALEQGASISKCRRPGGSQSSSPCNVEVTSFCIAIMRMRNIMNARDKCLLLEHPAGKR